MEISPIESEGRATSTAQKRYDRQAAIFDLTEVPMELLIFRGLRQRLWRQIDGQRILEIGVGTGKNLAFHPADAQVVALDLSPRMLRRAVRRAEQLERPPDFLLADVQHLPFRDGVFEDVASTFVFCSVPDPVAGLQEAKRVAMSDGRLNFIEHVRAPNPLLGWFMDRLNPIAVRLTGANINRDTVRNVESAGITIDSVDSKWLGIFRLMRGHHPQSAPLRAAESSQLTPLSAVRHQVTGS